MPAFACTISAEAGPLRRALSRGSSTACSVGRRARPVWMVASPLRERQRCVYAVALKNNSVYVIQ